MLSKTLSWMVILVFNIWTVWNIKFMFTKVRQWVSHRFWVKTLKYFRWLTMLQVSITSCRKEKNKSWNTCERKAKMKCCYQSRITAKLILLPWDKSTFRRYKCEITQTFIFKFYLFYCYVKWADSHFYCFML